MSIQNAVQVGKQHKNIVAVLSAVWKLFPYRRESFRLLRSQSF